MKYLFSFKPFCESFSVFAVHVFAFSVAFRKGSGSACRSVYGGFVEWRMGKEIDGSDSIAKQIKPHTHWPQLRILILVVSSSL